MTIIASISNDSQAAAYLVGDSMLSVKSGSERHLNVQFPIKGNVNKALAADINLSAVGHSQKLVKIRNDLCIAWAGDYRSACQIAVYLRKKTILFNNITKSQMDELAEAILTQYDGVSWILVAVLDDGSYRLASNVERRDYTDSTTIRVAGTGTGNFISNFEKNLSSGEGSWLSGREKKQYQAMAYCGLAFMDHILGDATPSEAWGGVMEAMSYTGTAIERLNPIATFFWKAIEQQDRKWAVALLPMFMYQYTDQESTVSLSYHVPKRMAQLVCSSSPFETREQLENLPAQFQTNMTFHCIELESPRFKKPERRLVVDITPNPDTDGVTLDIVDGNIRCRTNDIRGRIVGKFIPGEECSNLLEWEQYDPAFDWVSPLWGE